MRKSILSAVAGVTFLLGIAACSEENKYDSSVVTDIQLYLDDEAHSFLGEILLQEGDYEEAYYHLSKSLELNEDDMETMKLKGEACLHLEYYEEAVSVFETVLREDSYDLHCRLKLALAYAKMGDDANAERQIQIIDQMSQSADFSGLPNEKSQQWKNVHGAIQSLKRFLLDHIDDSENKESLS